jgi:hypothetical protein
MLYEFLCFSHLPGCDKPSGEPALRLFALPVGSFRLLLHNTKPISMLVTRMEQNHTINCTLLYHTYWLSVLDVIQYWKFAGLYSPLQDLLFTLFTAGIRYAIILCARAHSSAVRAVGS